jgi:hypothetical protein
MSGWYRQTMPLAQSLARFADEIRRHIGEWIERNPEGAARIALWLEDQMEPSEEAGAPPDLIRSFIQALVPCNWWDLSIGMRVQTQRFMAETGICLVWVPPAEVVQALISAKAKEERDEVLTANAALILDAVGQALSEATHPQLAVTESAAREALAAPAGGAQQGGSEPHRIDPR